MIDPPFIRAIHGNRETVVMAHGTAIEGPLDAAELFHQLSRRVRGDVRSDVLSRTLYATDASIYQVIPLGVVLPRDVEDVVATVEQCRGAGIAVIARGAGTGLTGGAVGAGVQLDLSRYMNRIGDVDLDAETVVVGPGVVLDELNAQLAPLGRHFAPDVATSSRATIGGMIANNSCGARSIVNGRTVDHVSELTVVLAGGEVVTFRTGAAEPAPPDGGRERSAAWFESQLAHIRDDCHDEIARRFPKILRSNGGYGLDRLGPSGPSAEAVKILCGSEGTLGIVVGAKLRLTRLPRATGLVVLHYADLSAALETTPRLLEFQPSAVELIDRMILDAGRLNRAVREQCGFLRGDPTALMVVEVQGDGDKEVSAKLEAISSDAEIRRSAYADVKVLDKDSQADVWSLRTSGLGLLMSKPGPSQPYAFVEDSAVDPSRLHEYIERFGKLLDGEGVSASYYAHASVGCLHVRPVLNLKNLDDVRRMRRIADGVSSLALEFGGAMTGEHGDGIVRSCWLEKMYGPRIIEAFHSVKRLFDPENLLNPHKIVDPWPMTEHLRVASSEPALTIRTHLDFSAYGGMAGLAEMCSGVGRCRQKLVGTMCPSYMATDEETHTTRARANALRMALSDRTLLTGLDDPHLAEVMDLCISCKACKTECPTGVDMARLKAEYLSHRNLTRGVSPRARLVADMPRRLAWASRFTRVFNLIAQNDWVRGSLERRYGLDRRVPPPRLARTTFRRWFKWHSHRKGIRGANGHDGHAVPPDEHRGRVVYFVDTWTNYITPGVGIAAVRILERAGYEVLCPRIGCCGRPAISQGLLTEAKQHAAMNVRRLARFAAAGVPIVGTEPSCVFTLVDEYPQLVSARAARTIAEHTFTLERFLSRLLELEPSALTFRETGDSMLYHAHCHQKAMIGTRDTATLMRRVWGDRAREINSGCCGMAGSFGHEKEHYEVAKAIGEQRLFPAVRNRGDALVAVSGFSCRHQIMHHTGVEARHLVEHLADILA